MDLAARIRDYYFKNFDKLSPSRQFHFASRLAAWEGSAEATEKLRDLRGFMLPRPPRDALSGLLKHPLGAIYENQKRRPYFEKYSTLHGINAALFRLKHLKDIYSVDARDVFWELVSREELQELNQSLRSDKDALRWLSSFAVNHLYLAELLFGKDFSSPPELLLDAAQAYDFSDAIQLNLCVYLFTHCIIADSNFYFRHPPADKRPVYTKMLETMDELIDCGPVKLDAWLECLVANRILGRYSSTEEKLYKQLPSLLSPDGGYLIEPAGRTSRKSPNSLDASEHRNVLYIMSTSEFSPYKVRA